VIDAEDLLDGLDVRVVPAQARVLGDDLLVLLRAAVTGSGDEVVPASVVSLLEAVMASARCVSDVGSDGRVRRIVEDVHEQHTSWVTAAEAGDRVGLGPRRVRQLASAEVVRSRAEGPRAPVFVVLEDVRAYVAGGGR
jgi:hypothetical protein